MNKLILFFLLLFAIPNFAQQNSEKKQTYSQTEIDLKLQLQEQRIKELERQIDEQKEVSQVELHAQDKLVEKISNDYSDHISLCNGWMTEISVAGGIISIIAAIIIALIGYFFNYKIKDISKEVDKKLEDISKEADKKLESISEKEEEAKQRVSNIEKAEKEATQTANSNPPDQQSPQNKEKIAKYVEEAKKVKTEADYTAEDWFLKGYNAQTKDQLEDACFYYKKAAEIDPNKANIYYNWGNALARLASIEGDKNSLEQSCEMYKKAAEINPNDAKIYYNWGTVLMVCSKIQGKLQENKEEIEKLYSQANELKSNIASYKLACLYALLNDKVQALQWIEKELQCKFYNFTREQIESESDFDNIKNDEEFKALLNSFFPKDEVS